MKKTLEETFLENFFHEQEASFEGLSNALTMHGKTQDWLNHHQELIEKEIKDIVIFLNGNASGQLFNARLKRQRKKPITVEGLLWHLNEHLIYRKPKDDYLRKQVEKYREQKNKKFLSLDYQFRRPNLNTDIETLAELAVYMMFDASIAESESYSWSEVSTLSIRSAHSLLEHLFQNTLELPFKEFTAFKRSLTKYKRQNTPYSI